MIFNVNSGAGAIPINVVPSTNSSFTYDGGAKTPVWQNYDPEQLSIGGAISAANAGTHTVYFTPKSGYTWADGTTDSRPVTWSIAKATGTMSLSATSGSILDQKGTTTTFNVNYNGDAAISVVSSNTGVATASVSGKTVTVTSVANGSATITVSVGNSNNYTTPESVTYIVQIEIRLYLYKLGDKCASNGTGSWTPAEKWHSYDYYYQTHNGNPKTPTVTYNADNVVVNCGGSEGYRSGIFYKSAKINLAEYSKITFDGLLNRQTVSLYAWSSIGNLYDSEHVVAKQAISNTSRSLVTLSISSLTSSNYIGFGLFGNGGSGAQATMYQLYLS